MLLPILFLFKTKISDYFKYSKNPDFSFSLDLFFYLLLSDLSPICKG